MSVVYILLLKDNCYYIGRTDQDIEFMFKTHLNGYSVWTKIHKPIEIIKIIRDANSLTELQIFKEYVMRYGSNKVRGDLYHQENELVRLEKVLWKENGKCQKCGRGHSGSGSEICTFKTDINGRTLFPPEIRSCYYCGASSHYAQTCPQNCEHADDVTIQPQKDSEVQKEHVQSETFFARMFKKVW